MSYSSRGTWLYIVLGLLTSGLGYVIAVLGPSNIFALNQIAGSLLWLATPFLLSLANKKAHQEDKKVATVTSGLLLAAWGVATLAFGIALWFLRGVNFTELS